MLCVLVGDRTPFALLGVSADRVKTVMESMARETLDSYQVPTIKIYLFIHLLFEIVNRYNYNNSYEASLPRGPGSMDQQKIRS